MEIIFSQVGMINLLFTVILFFYAARKLPLGALSLPCMMIMTTLIYFYVMPMVFLGTDYNEWFGLSLIYMDRVYLATFLYTAGAALAFWFGRKTLLLDPVRADSGPVRTHNPMMFRLLLGVALGGIFVKIYTGGLVLGEAEGTTFQSSTALSFLNLSYSILISLSVFSLVKARFSVTSVVLFVVLLFLFVMEGFRFRIVVLTVAAAIAFLLINRVRIRVSLVAVAAVAVIPLLNGFAMGRTYGRGFNLGSVQIDSWGQLFRAFGGEVGPIFVLYHISNRIPDLIYFEPWINTLTGFIPNILWPDKPVPEYLMLYTAGFPDPNAASAGIAATQHSEFLLQFGWFGLPVLAFAFFSLVLACLRGLSRLGYEGRVAGFTIIPPLFGFYAQQRGYTFQVVAETVFTVGPLFLLYVSAPLAGRGRKAKPA